MRADFSGGKDVSLSPQAESTSSSCDGLLQTFRGAGLWWEAGSPYPLPELYIFQHTHLLRNFSGINLQHQLSHSIQVSCGIPVADLDLQAMP